MCVCVYVCLSHLRNDASQWTRDFCLKGVLQKFGFWKTGFFKALFSVFQPKNILGSLRTSLLCIVWELPRGKSVAVAVCNKIQCFLYGVFFFLIYSFFQNMFLFTVTDAIYWSNQIVQHLVQAITFFIMWYLVSPGNNVIIWNTNNL